MTTNKMDAEKKEAGKHGFDGACAPDGVGMNYDTFSVGVFQWLAKSSGKGVKRSSVKVRVRGYCSYPDKVYAAAAEVVAALDAGTYNGGHTVTVR